MKVPEKGAERQGYIPKKTPGSILMIEKDGAMIVALQAQSVSNTRLTELLDQVVFKFETLRKEYGALHRRYDGQKEALIELDKAMRNLAEVDTLRLEEIKKAHAHSGRMEAYAKECVAKFSKVNKEKLLLLEAINKKPLVHAEIVLKDYQKALKAQSKADKKGE